MESIIVLRRFAAACTVRFMADGPTAPVLSPFFAAEAGFETAREAAFFFVVPSGVLSVECCPEGRRFERIMSGGEKEGNEVRKVGVGVVGDMAPFPLVSSGDRDLRRSISKGFMAAFG
jgi:hypothetical protein